MSEEEKQKVSILVETQLFNIIRAIKESNENNKQIEIEKTIGMFTIEIADMLNLSGSIDELEEIVRDKLKGTEKREEERIQNKSRYEQER